MSLQKNIYGIINKYPHMNNPLTAEGSHEQQGLEHAPIVSMQ